MNNIIKFPKYNEKVEIEKIEESRKPKTLEDVNEMMEQVRYSHIYETMSTIVPMIYNKLEAAGFNFNTIEDDEGDVILCGDGKNFSPFMKDSAMFTEALFSMLCKYYSIYHRFQELVEVTFVEDEDEDYVIAEKIKIKFMKDNELKLQPEKEK